MNKVYAGTGSRELVLNSDKMKQVQLNIEKMFTSIKDKNITPYMLCGGAEGFDEALALACINSNIPFTLALPNNGYAYYYWRKKSLLERDRFEDFNFIARKANKILYICNSIYVNGRHSNFIRNEWMVDNCVKLWVYNPITPGTRGCLDYAKKTNRIHYLIPIV